ncbi:MAG: putative toxin-antitoxin system toxin component, PIN family [Flavobacteriaceae bacterium]|jgi:putative PIN family toxin of toxin-antitoxin system|nr:putative toxin-antitoxin system toxin component, PIN family [Flavobacteriaceae bacterium]
MKHIVLDTNCLLACIGKSSKFHSIWTAFLSGKFYLCLSNEIVTEYEEIFSKKTSPAFAEMIIHIILNSENIVLVNPYYRFGLITTDPDDNKFVDCAVIASADYIVSNDVHFNILKTINFPKINVIRIEQFAGELEKNL